MTKITISQEGANPISITLHERSNESNNQEIDQDKYISLLKNIEPIMVYSEKLKLGSKFTKDEPIHFRINNKKPNYDIFNNKHTLFKEYDGEEDRDEWALEYFVIGGILK